MVIRIFEKFKNLKKVYRDIDKSKEGIDSISNKISTKFSSRQKSDSDPLKKLKKIVNKISKSLGCKSEVRYMNSGSYGMAFSVDDKVIKLTSDKGEAMIAKKLVNKNIPNTVRYYKVKKIQEYEIWAILMDKAESFTKEEKKIIEIIDECAYYDSPKKIKNELDESYIEAKEQIEYRKLSVKLFKKMWNDYKNMCISLIKNGISMDDLHPGNIGYLGDEMVHFDIMYQTSLEDISKLS